VGCCAWPVIQAPPAASAGPPGLAGIERPPVEAPRPAAASFRESAGAVYHHLSAGDANAARAVVLAAIAAHPDDAGRRWAIYAPPAGQRIPDARELRAALRALPSLDDLVQRRPDIREWLLFAFSGFGSEPIVWEDAPPPFDWEACSGRDRDGKPYVRVRKTTASGGGPEVPESGEVLLARLVFELFNVQNLPAGEELDDMAQLGTISRDDYVAAKVDLEGDALELTRAFFANVLLAVPDRSELSPLQRLSTWRLSDDDEQRAGLYDPRRKRDENSYPWFPFGIRYDHLTASELVRQKEYRRALEILDRMRLVDRLDPSRKASVHVLTARCHQGLGRTDIALEHATVAVRLYPSASTYECRAEILRLTGRKAEAEEGLRQVELFRLRDLFAR
jgi:tetratricopeptide (TPR) repeat protein